MSLPQIKTASVVTSKTFPLLSDTLTAYISEAKFMPKGFFILFFLAQLPNAALTQ